jgi:hypothetical protein
MDEMLRGTILVNWAISQRDARCPPDDPLTREQVLAVLDRVEEAVCEGLPQEIGLYLDGEDAPPVQLTYEVDSNELEIEEGPSQLVGMVPFLREADHFDGDWDGDED